jgi:hypothetical protein
MLCLFASIGYFVLITAAECRPSSRCLPAVRIEETWIPAGYERVFNGEPMRLVEYQHVERLKRDGWQWMTIEGQPLHSCLGKEEG